MTEWERLRKDHEELRAKVLKLADKANRAHTLALRAHGRYMRVQGGTTTSNREWASYERHTDAFDAAIEAMKAAANTY